MKKRTVGLIVIASALTIMAFAVMAAFFTNTTQAAAPIKAVPAPIAAAPFATPHPATSAPNPIRPDVGSWADIAPYPTVTIQYTPTSSSLRLKRAGAAAYPPNGKLYVLGGRHGTDGEDAAMREIWEYTTGTNSWVSKASLLDNSFPSNQGLRYTANMAVAVLTNTNGPRIYAIGGNSIDSDITSTVRIYDPNADALTLLTSDPWPANPKRVPGGYAVYNNKLYIFGGFSALGNGAVYAETWVFDPMAGSGAKWSQIGTANLGLARGYIAGAVLDGKIYAIGGDTWDAGLHQLSPVANVEILDPNQLNPAWTAITSLPSPLGDMGAWAYDSGTGYETSGSILIGGGGYPVPGSKVLQYKPGGSWNVISTMSHATRNYGVAQLNGFLYAFGGYDYSNNIPAGANFNQRYDATGPVPTPTNTPINSPTATNTPVNYNSCQLTGVSIDPGTTLVTGSQCDDCVVTVTLPFPYTFYNQTFSTIYLSSNGKAGFITSDANPVNTCLPDLSSQYAIYGYWDDLTTASGGIFISTVNSAPNRIFNIEWRGARTSNGGGGNVNFEIRLYENAPQLDMVYASMAANGASGTVGVQKNSTSFTQFSCNTGSLTSGLQLTFTQVGGVCPSPTPTFTRTNTPTITNTVTGTPPTATPTPICQTILYTSTNVPVAINDNSASASVLTIAGSGSITDIDLTGLDITHTYIGDLQVSLTSPSNTTVQLITNVCGNQDNMNVTLDDSAATVIGTSCASPYTGTYRPANALSAFNGQNMNGVWTLTVADTATTDVGSLNGWGLTITTGIGCGPTATNTPGPTNTATVTNTRTNTATNTSTVTGTPPTSTPTIANTSTPTFTSTPCGVVQLLSEGFESGLGQFTPTQVATPNADWAAVTTDKHGGLQSAFVPDPAFITDNRLTTISAVSIPGGAISPVLSFWHLLASEATFDGGVLEISTDAGTTWLTPTFTLGGYNATISTGFNSPLAGRTAWSGNIGSTGVFTNVVTNLSPYIGTSILFRFRFASDSSVAATGWWVDDIVVTYSTSTGCNSPTPSITPGGPTFTPTKTNTSTNTRTSTSTSTVTSTRTSTSTSTPTTTGTPPTATPTSACGSSTQLLSEGFEGGTLGAFTGTSVASPVATWTNVTTAAHSGTRAAWVDDAANQVDVRLTTSSALSIPANASAASLTFWHRYRFERNSTPARNWDGGVLEVSTNGGANFNDVGAGNITSGGYNGQIATTGQGNTNPLAGRQAWISSTNTLFVQVAVNLLPYAGQNVLFRFREGTDNSNGSAVEGWWVDDIVVSVTTSCTTNTPTVTRTSTALPPSTSTSTSTRTSTNTPTATATSTLQWRTDNSPTGMDLRDVYMVAFDDGWAVGNAGTALHYNGSTWQSVNVGTSVRTTDDLVDVFMLSSTNGYILGWAANGDGHIFHYDGSSWNLEYTAAGQAMYRTDGVSANDVWVVGNGTTILHWNGIQWSVVPATTNNNPNLRSVSMVSASEGWAVGQFGDILHYSGGVWSQIANSPASVTILDSFFTAPNNGWAAGLSSPSYILRYDGAQWTQVYTDTEGIYRLWMYSSSSGWGVGSNAIDYYNGSAWTGVNNPTSNFLSSIYMVSASEGWIVGGAGTILHYYDSAAPTRTPTNTRTATSTPTITATYTATDTPTPNPDDAYAHLYPGVPITVNVGTQFSLDLFVNSGSHSMIGQSSYMSFTNSILQNVDANQTGCVQTSTITGDYTSFTTEFQNEVCNGPNPCNFSDTTDPGSIGYVSTAPSNISGDFHAARLAFCATSPGDAVIHWQFSPPAPANRNSEITDSSSNVWSNPAMYTDYYIHVIPYSGIIGHVTWQGRPTQPSVAQQMPISLTLRPVGGGAATEYTDLWTDSSGMFAVPTTGLALGNYTWRAKGPTYNAVTGTLTLTVAPNLNVEMGTQPAGDCDNDNNVSLADFNIVKNSFGRIQWSPDYDARAEYDGSTSVGLPDFNLMKSNFGRLGAGAIRPVAEVAPVLTGGTR